MTNLFDAVEELGMQLGNAFVAAFERQIGTLNNTAAQKATRNAIPKPHATKHVGRKPNPDAQKNQPCIVKGCTRNRAAHKLCNPHYAKAKHFKIDLTQKIPAKLLKLLATDGRKVDLKVLAGGKAVATKVAPKQKQPKQKRTKANGNTVVPVDTTQKAVVATKPF